MICTNTLSIGKESTTNYGFSNSFSSQEIDEMISRMIVRTWRRRVFCDSFKKVQEIALLYNLVKTVEVFSKDCIGIHYPDYFIPIVLRFLDEVNNVDNDLTRGAVFSPDEADAIRRIRC